MIEMYEKPSTQEFFESELKEELDVMKEDVQQFLKDFDEFSDLDGNTMYLNDAY